MEDQGEATEIKIRAIDRYSNEGCDDHIQTETTAVLFMSVEQF